MLAVWPMTSAERARLREHLNDEWGAGCLRSHHEVITTALDALDAAEARVCEVCGHIKGQQSTGPRSEWRARYELLGQKFVAMVAERDAAEARVAALEAALRDVLALVDERWLVRKMTNDGLPMSSFLAEATRLVTTLSRAQAALTPGGPA